VVHGPVHSHVVVRVVHCNVPVRIGDQFTRYRYNGPFSSGVTV
jgi:hypothetical protein